MSDYPNSSNRETHLQDLDTKHTSEKGIFDDHAEDDAFNLEGIDHELIVKYEPKFLARGGEHIVYDIAGHPDIVVKEAATKNKELVEGETVRLGKDTSETNRYGRLLRYVFIGNDMVNRLLVKKGYATVATFPPDMKYHRQFLDAEREAREQKRGLWASCPTHPSHQ
jgi:hypothetical protein